MRKHILHTLFEFEEKADIDFVSTQDEDNNEKIAITVNYPILQTFLKEWNVRKQELEEGSITEDEYQEWKLNWPNSCDDLGKVEPTYQWRKK